MDQNIRDTLRDREQELKKRIFEIRQQLDPLEKELADVQRAKHALGMLGGTNVRDNAGSAMRPVHIDPLDARALQYMTMKELVLKALAEHFQNGTTSKELVLFFASAWGRRIGRENLSPQLSRLKSDGFLDRQGNIWLLTDRGNKGAKEKVQKGSPEPAKG
jgi:hypothetical protein